MYSYTSSTSYLYKLQNQSRKNIKKNFNSSVSKKHQIWSECIHEMSESTYFVEHVSVIPATRINIETRGIIEKMIRSYQTELTESGHVSGPFMYHMRSKIPWPLIIT